LPEEWDSPQPCWISFFSQREPIRTANGSYMKLKPYNCLHAWECVNRFSKTLHPEKTYRITELGLLTDPNPLGIDQILEWLGKRCNHPEKRKILSHIASLEPLGVVIPWDVLALIENHAQRVTQRYTSQNREEEEVL